MRPLILTKFHFASLWNWRNSYLGRFIEPVAYLLFLSAGLQGALEDRTGPYAEFILAGMVCLLSFRAATASMSDVSNDRKWGVFAIYVLQGGSTMGYMLSIVIFASSVFLGQLILLLLCSFLVFGGSAPDVGSMSSLAGLGILLVIGWSGFGAALGGKINSYAARDLVVTVTSLPVILAAPLFYPISGGWLGIVAAFNPLTYQVEVLREPAAVWVLAVVAWAVVGFLLAVFALRRAESLSRER